MSMRRSNAGAYLRWIIASEYYDGAMAGIGERAADGAPVWFRVVAWDEEQWLRVFAVAAVAASLTQCLVHNLEKVEPRKEPFWLPGVHSVTGETRRGWGEIARAAARAKNWWLVEAHDLGDPAGERPVLASDIPRVVAGVRTERVLAVTGPSLVDSFLQRIRLNDGTTS